MGIRRQLFLAQTVTLALISAGALGGWALSSWIGRAPQQEAQRLAVEREHLAHMSYDLLGATPHTGLYLFSTPAELEPLIQRDITGLTRFRRELDEHLADLTLISADPKLHRELETIRLLSVQVERSLSRVERELRLAQQQGRQPDPTLLAAAVRHPSIDLIRRHSDLLAGLHESLDQNHARMLAAQQQALDLGVSSWSAMLLAAWVIGLLLAWHTSNRLLDPLIRLERLMRQPAHQLADKLAHPLFSQAPAEIASLSRSFQKLVLEVTTLLEQLENQLRTDGLTTVGNRRHFDAMLEQEWTRAARRTEPLSLLLLDVDHFKLYNDHYGHISGDRCLQRVAQAISSRARRSSDVVCRIGGEEFAVLLPTTTAMEASLVAEQIVQAIDELAIEHASSPVASWVTASIGVASCTPVAGLNPRELMRRADAALYVRKQEQGRHGVVMADPAPQTE